jgi:prepilin-type N-terminal cleavage/methylation domain-containing protein
MGRRSGFTLIETLLAVIIVGVMTLMAYPRVNNAMVKSNLRGARTRVVNMLSAARAAATQGGRSASYLRFNGNTAVVTASPRRVALAGSTEDTLGVAVNLSTAYGATVAVSNGTTQIAYDSRGIAAGVSANPVTITLTHGSYSQTVGVDMLGRVTK